MQRGYWCNACGDSVVRYNKGDEAHPNYRSRWVAQQYRRAWVDAIFSATPNIESVRLLLADAAGQCKEVGPLHDEIQVMIVDIKRAYFYAPSQKPPTCDYLLKTRDPAIPTYVVAFSSLYMVLGTLGQTGMRPTPPFCAG